MHQLLTQLFSAVEAVDINLAKFIKQRDWAFAALPSVGEQLDMLLVQRHTLGLGIARPWAVLSKSKRIMEDAAANHDTIQAILFGQGNPLCSVLNVTVADQLRLRRQFVP